MAVREKVVEEFVEALSSKAPIPGGGGAAALGAVLGNALGQMVANLTIGKKKYASVEAEIVEVQSQLIALQEECFVLAERDEEVFLPLSAAYALPTNTEEEKEKKQAVMEECLLAASLVPLRLMESSVQTLHLLDTLGTKGSRLAVSDVGVGVQFVRTALCGAAMNVWINTKTMKNREQAEKLKRQAQNYLDEGRALADKIYDEVQETLQA
ncbi:MAG: cyclodeaminase/cyclohydrolase family protein [bacterium]|nr:cyclodeaminase/cyclohydrolase family protein [bacterium]